MLDILHINLKMLVNDHFFTVITLYRSEGTCFHVFVHQLTLDFILTIFMLTVDQNIFAFFLVNLKEITYLKIYKNIFHAVRIVWEWVFDKPHNL